MIIDFEWNTFTFLAGAIATFAYKFLNQYIPNLLRTKDLHIIRTWVWDDWIYIILGGLFTVAMNPVRIIQALIFGASWEAIFINMVQKTKEAIKNGKTTKQQEG